MNGVSRRERHTRSRGTGHGINRPLEVFSHKGYNAVKWITSPDDRSEVKDLYDNRNVRLKRNLRKTGNLKHIKKSKGVDVIGDNLKTSKKVHKRLKRDLESYSQTKSCSLDFKTLMVGCGTTDTMEFRSDCPAPDSNMVSGKCDHFNYYSSTIGKPFTFVLR